MAALSRNVDRVRARGVVECAFFPHYLPRTAKDTERTGFLIALHVVPVCGSATLSLAVEIG